MEHSNINVLAAGIERMVFENLAPVIRRNAVRVDWVATPEAGTKLAAERRYDVILMDAEPCDWPLEEVVRSFRDPSSPSRGAAILVLAQPDQVDVARALRNRGVNRVMLASDPPEIICDQVASLLEVAPRVQVRLATNVEAALGSKGRELFCQTVNLSATGMLIRTRHRPPVGSPVVFKITLPEGYGTVCGRGELIRHASTSQGGTDGVAIRFMSFANNGAEQIQAYLESMTTEPEADLLTDLAPEAREAPPPAREATPSVQRVRRTRDPNDPFILEFE